MITLRPDQVAAKADVYNAWNSGARNVLLVAATGWGKSVVLSDIAYDCHANGNVQAILAHRNELVGQLSGHIARRGIPHRVIASAASVSQIVSDHRREFGRSFINPDAKCAVVSVDTLNARADALKEWAFQVNDWTLDEAHHVQGNEIRPQNKWARALAMFINARGLGVTASPVRGDGGGLGRYQSDGTDGDGPFETMVQAPPMRWLIDNGALTDYEIAIPESDFHIDDEELAPSGDWSSKKMREASKRSHIVGDVVKEYSRRAFGKRAICFATDVETAGEMAQWFNAAGIPAAAVSAKTPSDVRADYIRRFRAGQFWVLVNVDLFGEGFDVPAVEVVIMARPTASLAVYLQQFGRALRTLPGKAYGLVIDHVSNWKRHGFPDKAHAWTLDRREKRGKRERDPEELDLTACRTCSRPYERVLPACPHCGAVPPLPAPGARTIEAVDGDLFLIDRERAAAMRAATQLPTPADVANRAAFVAGPIAGAGAANKAMERIAAQDRLKAAFAQYAGIQRHKGRDDAQTHKRIYQTLGMDLLTALSAERSRADFDKTAEIVEGWCKL